MSIVCISATSRPDNFTHRALVVVQAELASLGQDVVSFDAREMQLAFPGQADTADSERLQAAVKSAHGIVLATPEYHGTFSAMAKLIIENLGFPSHLKGKPIALLGVAAGRIGAIKSLEHLRGVCAHTGALVVPHTVSIAGVRSAFDGETCIDEGVSSALAGLAKGLIDFMGAYVCPRFVLEESVRGGDGKPWTATS